MVGVGCGDCVDGGTIAGRGGVKLIFTVGGVIFHLLRGFWANVHGFSEVLPQGEVEVADLELLEEFEGDIAISLALWFSCARQPSVNGCLRDRIAPPAANVSSVCVDSFGNPSSRILTRNTMK
jgi:hypothetical protein